MKTIDARGVPCPKPLILTKSAITNMQLNEEVMILVDDEVSHKNITDFLKDRGINFKIDGLNFNITKNKEIMESSEEKKSYGHVIAVIDKEYMGLGNDELGTLLLKAFIGALKDASPKPEAVYFFNGGVLITQDKAFTKLLEELRSAKIKLYFCGTCVKFYELKNIKVEEQTNMLGIIEAMGKASSIIRA